MQEVPIGGLWRDRRCNNTFIKTIEPESFEIFEKLNRMCAGVP